MTKDDDSPWMDRLAHDLRGPLAPLQTAVYLLRRDDLDPARREELVAMLDRQTRRMARMLDELDDWTRVGRDELLGHTERCDLALLLDFAMVAAGVNGTPVDGDGALVEVLGDQKRLTQLLRTLVDLGIAGGGAPRLKLQADAALARVEACMPGPPPDACGLAQLFERPQAQPYDEGLGLRLMLARVIARAHGGELTALVENDALVLRLELPLAPSP